MKYEEVDETTQELFDSVLNQTSIPQWVTFRVLENEKLKDCVSIKKQSDLSVTLSDVNIAIIINPVVFGQLEDQQKRLILEECLSGINVNPDSDKIEITKFDFCSYSGFLAKYGDSTVIKLKETIKSLFDAEEEKQKQLKAQKAEKKKKKSF